MARQRCGVEEPVKVTPISSFEDDRVIVEQYLLDISSEFIPTQDAWVESFDWFHPQTLPRNMSDALAAILMSFPKREITNPVRPRFVNDLHAVRDDFRPTRALRLDQVAERLSVSGATVYKWIKAGKLPAPRRVGSMALWVENEVEAAIRALLGVPGNALPRLISTPPPAKAVDQANRRPGKSASSC